MIRNKPDMGKIAASAARSAMMLVELNKAFFALQKHMQGGHEDRAEAIAEFLSALLYIETTARKIIDEAASMDEGTAKLIAKIREEMKNAEVKDGNWK